MKYKTTKFMQKSVVLLLALLLGALLSIFAIAATTVSRPVAAATQQEQIDSKTTIQPRAIDISIATVVLPYTSVTYTGAAFQPLPTAVTLGGKSLNKDFDYRISWQDNINAGLGKVVLTGINGYSGTVEASFNIARAQQPELTTSEVVVNSVGTLLSNYTLSPGWVWQNGNTELTANTTFVTALYEGADKGNYIVTSKTIPVRWNAPATGGTTNNTDAGNTVLATSTNTDIFWIIGIVSIVILIFALLIITIVIVLMKKQREDINAERQYNLAALTTLATSAIPYPQQSTNYILPQAPMQQEQQYINAMPPVVRRVNTIYRRAVPTRPMSPRTAYYSGVMPTRVVRRPREFYTSDTYPNGQNRMYTTPYDDRQMQQPMPPQPPFYPTSANTRYSTSNISPANYSSVLNNTLPHTDAGNNNSTTYKN